MRRINLVNFAVLVIGFFSVVSIAAEPATKPAAKPTATPTTAPSSGTGDVDLPPQVPEANPGTPSTGTSSIDESKPRRGDRGNFPEGSPGGRFRNGLRGLNPVTPSEIKEAMDFMKDNSPNRLKAIESLPDNDRRRNFTDLATRNYLNWSKMRTSDPELYAVVLKRVKLEDDVFGIVVQLRQEPPDKHADTEAQLKNAVGKLVDVGIQERQMRLDRLIKTVQDQQQVLEADKASRDKLVEDRMKNIQSDVKGLLARPR